MRGKQHKWRAQQRSQVADRGGNNVGADITSVSRDQRLTGPLLLHLLHHGIHLMTLVLLRFLYLSLFIWQHFKKKIMQLWMCWPFFHFSLWYSFLCFYLALALVIFDTSDGHALDLVLFLGLTCRGFSTPYTIKYCIGYKVCLLTWFISEVSISYPCIYIM